MSQRASIASALLVLVAIGAVAVGAMLHDGNMDRKSSGSFYYDREILERYIDRNPGVPLYLPAELPRGYEFHNVVSVERDEAVGVATERLLRFTNFDTGNSAVAYLCVGYQNSQVRPDPRCRSNGYREVIVREIDEFVIYVSFKGVPSVDSRNAWRTAELVSDLDVIDWLSSS